LKKMSNQDRNAVICCMDECIEYNTLAFGAVASLIVAPGYGGNQDVYSHEDRLMVMRVRPFVFSGLRAVVKSLGLFGPFVTSHQECGGAGAQGIDDARCQTMTARLATENGLAYLGHVQAVGTPQPFSFYPELQACVARPEKVHHPASRVIYTIGGGATMDEIEQAVGGDRCNAFLVSMDWPALAFAGGRVHHSMVSQYAELHLRIAAAIAPGVALNLGKAPLVLDVGRLPNLYAEQNFRFLYRTLGPGVEFVRL
jgi:hypothetical protein